MLVNHMEISASYADKTGNLSTSCERSRAHSQECDTCPTLSCLRCSCHSCTVCILLCIAHFTEIQYDDNNKSSEPPNNRAIHMSVIEGLCCCFWLLHQTRHVLKVYCKRWLWGNWQDDWDMWLKIFRGVEKIAKIHQGEQKGNAG